MHLDNFSFLKKICFDIVNITAMNILKIYIFECFQYFPK